MESAPSGIWSAMGFPWVLVAPSRASVPKADEICARSTAVNSGMAGDVLLPFWTDGPGESAPSEADVPTLPLNQCEFASTTIAETDTAAVAMVSPNRAVRFMIPQSPPGTTGPSN